jgi:hypothetical protein
LEILDDPRYPALRNQLLSFLEERAQSDAAVLAEALAAGQPGSLRVSAEELFVIEKYSGFNRFRARYRNLPDLQAGMANMPSAPAKALS